MPNDVEWHMLNDKSLNGTWNPSGTNSNDISILKNYIGLHFSKVDIDVVCQDSLLLFVLVDAIVGWGGTFNSTLQVLG
jgi:hypothetical protein